MIFWASNACGSGGLVTSHTFFLTIPDWDLVCIVWVRVGGLGVGAGATEMVVPGPG